MPYTKYDKCKFCLYISNQYMLYYKSINFYVKKTNLQINNK